VNQCVTIQNKKEYHFLKVEPAQPSILNTQGFLFQRKWDGVSGESRIENREIEIMGRGVTKGRDSNYTLKFPELVKELKALNLPKETDFLHEIICVNQNTGLEDLELVKGRTVRENNIDLYAQLYPALMIVHDVISVGGWNVTDLPYFERLNALREILGNKAHRIVFIGNSTDGRAEWEKVEKYKLEGVVIRDPKMRLGHGIWKLKRELTEDVYCTGEYEVSTSDTNMNLEYEVNGVKKKGTFANLTCYQLFDTAPFVNRPIKVCDVGTGFSQGDRKNIQAMLDLGQITKENPLVIEVKANARHESGKLRHPRLHLLLFLFSYFFPLPRKRSVNSYTSCVHIYFSYAYIR
jgi:ATP-dependent DNA ligase